VQLFLSDLEHHGITRPVFTDEKRFFEEAYHCDQETINNTLNHIDTKYITPWIKATVFFGTGLFDDDCPSHVGFAAYNRITSEKTFSLYPDGGHVPFEAIADGRKFLKSALGF
jgi:cephalosporin-C deacetylase